MLKLAAHLHTLGKSGCAEISPEEAVNVYKSLGYDGLVVTNHYMKWIFEEYYPKISERGKLEFFLDGYRETKRFADKAGLLTFLGMELNLEPYNETGHTYPVCEFLCYGVTEDFILNHPKLYELTQQQAFELLDSHGIVMCQAHPFRNRTRFADPFLMHGIEVFNGNPRHNSRNSVAQAAAKEYGFIEIASDDCHQIVDAGSGALLVPDDTDTSEKLAQALRERKTQAVFKK